MELAEDTSAILHHLHGACVNALELRATEMTFHAWMVACLLPMEWWRSRPPLDIVLATTLHPDEYYQWHSPAMLAM